MNFARQAVLISFVLLVTHPAPSHGKGEATEAPSSEETPGAVPSVPPSGELKAWQDLEEDFRAKTDTLNKDFDRERIALQGELVTLNSAIQGESSQLEGLQGGIAGANVTLLGLRIRAFDVSWVNEFFPVLVINLLIFLRVTPRPPVPFVPALLVGVFVLLLFALPAFGAEPKKQDAPSLDDDLKTLNHLLGASPAEKGIFWLERLEKIGRLAPISVKDDLLTPFQEIRRGSAEYYFSLAALYWETGQMQAAAGALRKIPEAPSQTNTDLIYERTIRFLARESLDGLDEVSRELIPRMQDPVRLASLAAALSRSGHSTIRERAAKQILAITSSVADLAEAMNTSFNEGDKDTGVDLLLATFDRIRSIRDATVVTNVMLTHGLDNYLDRLIARIVAVATDSGSLLSLAGMVFDAGRPEWGRRLLMESIKRLRAVDDLKAIADFCLKRAEYQLAIQLLEYAIRQYGTEVATIPLPDPHLLFPKEGLPGDDFVSLAVLLANLNVYTTLVAGAGPAYDRSAHDEVTKILDAAAFEFPADLRSLFYVQRYWREQREDGRLSLLREPYKRLLDSSLSALGERHAQELSRLRQTRDESTAKLRDLRSRVAATAPELRRTQRAIFFWHCRLGALVIAVIAILVGCGNYAWLHALPFARFRTYAFFWRFTEALGWVSVLSVIAAPAGVVQMVVSQLFLIWKHTQEPVSQST